MKILLHYINCKIFLLGREMTAFIKLWAKHAKFNISGYALTLLVIFYFQTKCMLPAIEKLLPDHTKIDREKSPCMI